MSELSTEPTLNEQIGTLSGDTPLSDDHGMGEVTFDSTTGLVPKSQQGSDPMAKLHMPNLQQTTTTSVKATGGGQGGAGLPGGQSPSDLAGGHGPAGLTGFAQKFLGVPYVWGGTSPSGFDCSGFVQYVYKQFGVNLPRISADQARAGARVSFKDLRPGDLVAVDNSSRNNGADHIGIYLGNGMVIDAPRPGRSVERAPLSAFAGGWGVRINVPGGGGPAAHHHRPRRHNKFDGSL